MITHKKCAFYFASKGSKFVEFGYDGKLDVKMGRVAVSGKKEARQVAEKYQAICWNF